MSTSDTCGLVAALQAYEGQAERICKQITLHDVGHLASEDVTLPACRGGFFVTMSQGYRHSFLGRGLVKFQGSLEIMV